MNGVDILRHVERYIERQLSSPSNKGDTADAMAARIELEGVLNFINTFKKEV